MKSPLPKDRKQGQPRHAELSEELAKAIAAGAFPVGEKFPTENDLQIRFGVGRHTVREALKTLTDQGLLVRRRKVGTTVVGRRPQAQYSHLIRDVKGLLDFAGNTELKIAHMGMAVPGEALSDFFHERSSHRWLRIAGTRYTRHDQAPLSWSEIYIPEEFPLERERIRAGIHPLYEYCMSEHGLTLDHVEQEIRGGLLSEHYANLLDAEPGGASLILVRRYFDREGRVFEVSINVYSAERYSVKSVIRQKS